MIKLNYLASVEMSMESNYNMIDGIINNTPKPSVLKQMDGYEQFFANVPFNDGKVQNRSFDSQTR